MSNSKVGGNNQSGGGRRRSVSESDVWDLSTKPKDRNDSGDDLNQPLLSISGRGISNPNLSVSNAGFITTPIGAGVNTRLMSGRRDEKLHKRVVDEYLNLKDQIQTWQGLISGSNPSTKSDVERVFQTLDKRISDLAQGCLMRNYN